MIDYKKIGIKYFKRSKFKDAIFYFSLAYEKTQERNLLFLIQICSLGEENAEEAKLLFDYYMAKVRAGEDDEGVEEILKIAEDKIDFKEIMLEKMKNFSLEEMEKIILSVSKNELKHIEIIGGVLGGIIALFQFFIMLLLKQI